MGIWLPVICIKFYAAVDSLIHERSWRGQEVAGNRVVQELTYRVYNWQLKNLAVFMQRRPLFWEGEEQELLGSISKGQRNNWD